MDTITPIAPFVPGDSHNYTDPSGSVGFANNDGTFTAGANTGAQSAAGSGAINSSTGAAGPIDTSKFSTTPFPTYGIAPQIVNSTNTAPATPAVVPTTGASTSSLAGAAINGSGSSITSTMSGTGAGTTTGAGTGTGGTSTITPLVSAEDTKISGDQSAVDASKTSVDALIAQLSGKGAAQTAAEAAAGIPALTTQNAALVGQYNQLKASYDQQYQNILNTPGMSRGQANEQIAELSRQNNANLANIAIQQSVVSGNLVAAQNLVDHKIDLQYGDLKDLISYQQDYMKTNEANLSQDQKDKLQLQITDNTREYDKATADAKALEDQKLKTVQAMAANNATSAQMSEVQNAKTPEDVVAIAGKYGISLQDQLTKADIAKAYADAQKAGTTAPAMAGESLVLGKDAATATALEKAKISTADIVKVQGLLNQGYSLDQIAKLSNMPEGVYSALLPYVSTVKKGSALDQ